MTLDELSRNTWWNVAGTTQKEGAEIIKHAILYYLENKMKDKSIRIHNVKNGFIANHRPTRDDPLGQAAEADGTHVFETFGNLVDWLRSEFFGNAGGGPGKIDKSYNASALLSKSDSAWHGC